MKLRVILEYDPVANAYSATCAELPGCASAGVTEAEAISNMREAIQLYFEPTPLTLPPGAKEYQVLL